MLKKVIYVGIFVLVMCEMSSCNGGKMAKNTAPKELDLSSFSASPPSRKINLLFIHHSCGGQWLATPGPKDDCKNWICSTSRNGGGLRKLLEENNYVVHEASYGSIIGEKTDIQDWPSKFKNHMDRILRTRLQDDLLPDDEKNQIVMFKSCFPNNNFTTDTAVEEAKSAYRSLLPIFEKHPDVLFIAVTAPPLVSPNHLINLLKRLLGKWVPDSKSGERARVFNNWLKDVKTGWISHYPLHNVVVFDYYDILTKHGKSNWAEYGSKWGSDSHPSRKGNQVAAVEFITFLNKAIKYSGLEGKFMAESKKNAY